MQNIGNISKGNNLNAKMRKWGNGGEGIRDEMRLARTGKRKEGGKRKERERGMRMGGEVARGQTQGLPVRGNSLIVDRWSLSGGRK